MKWNSIVVKLHVLVFALKIWSLFYFSQGKGLGHWLHLLLLELLWHFVAMESFLGTHLRKASLAVTYLNTILLHQPSTLSMRYSSPMGSRNLYSFAAAIKQLTCSLKCPLGTDCLGSISHEFHMYDSFRSVSLWYSFPRSLYFRKCFSMLLVLLFDSFLFLETRDPGQCNCNITDLRIPWCQLIVRRWFYSKKMMPFILLVGWKWYPY